MQITGIILAGGKSKRMGTDKASLKLDGKTLLERCVELIQFFFRR
jgi:molybdopterin-guanine dinucleotide biosynthesis protein A